MFWVVSLNTLFILVFGEYTKYFLFLCSQMLKFAFGGPVIDTIIDQFLHYRLVSSFQIIDIGNTGNQNHPDLEVRVVLVTCISNIDFCELETSR